MVSQLSENYIFVLANYVRGAKRDDMNIVTVEAVVKEIKKVLYAKPAGLQIFKKEIK